MRQPTFFDLNPSEGDIVDFDVADCHFYMSDGEVCCGYNGALASTYEEAVPAQVFLNLSTSCGRMIRAVGDSMLEAHICPDDLLTVDPQRVAMSGDIVVMRVDGELTVKYFYHDRSKHCDMLVPANPDYPVLVLTPDMEAQMIGVVTWVGKAPQSKKAYELEAMKQRIDQNEQLQRYIERTAEAGYMDAYGEWVDRRATNEFKAVWVDAVSDALGFDEKWKWAEQRWGLKNLRKTRYNVMESCRFEKIDADVREIIMAE